MKDGYVGLTWRTGPLTGRFVPVGPRALLLARVYGPERLFVGVTGQYNPDEAVFQYGVVDNTQRLCFDMKYRPFPGAKGRILDANSPLADDAAAINKAASWYIRRGIRLPKKPRLPRHWLSFPRTSPPEVEDSPALSAMLGSGGDKAAAFRSMICEDPQLPGVVLAPADMVPRQGAYALRAFVEFVPPFAGRLIKNPAGDLLRSAPAVNPVRAVVSAMGLTVEEVGTLDDDLFVKVVDAIRRRVGPVDDDQLASMLSEPDKAWTGWRSLPEKYGSREAAKQAIRAALSPEERLAILDSELEAAVDEPFSPIVLSRLPAVSVIEVDTSVPYEQSLVWELPGVRLDLIAGVRRRWQVRCAS